MSETTRRAAVDLAVPCSPVRARIGCGMSGSSAATSQAIDEAESRLVDVQEAAQPVDRAAAGRFREGCRERRPAEQDGRAVDDLPAGGIEDDTPTRLTPEIEGHGVAPGEGDPQADVLWSGVIGLALEHGEGVVERRAARHHGLRGVEDPGEVLAQTRPARAARGRCSDRHAASRSSGRRRLAGTGIGRWRAARGETTASSHRCPAGPPGPGCRPRSAGP